MDIGLLRPVGRHTCTLWGPDARCTCCGSVSGASREGDGPAVLRASPWHSARGSHLARVLGCNQVFHAQGRCPLPSYRSDPWPCCVVSNPVHREGPDVGWGCL